MKLLTGCFLAGGLALGGLVPVNAQTSSAFVAAPRIHQVAVTVTDLPRAIGFYRDTLGLPFLFEANGMAFFDLGTARLMLGADRERPVVERPTSILYIDSTEFFATVSTLRERGVKFVAPIETVTKTATGTLMLAEFRDPDGNALAVMGEVADNSRIGEGESD